MQLVATGSNRDKLATLVNGREQAFYGADMVQFPTLDWAVFDRDPPFTTQQLSALVAHDEFEVLDWPGIFGVTPTPFNMAVEMAYTDPVYSQVILDF
jgi:hypothetical protein